MMEEVDGGRRRLLNSLIFSFEYVGGKKNSLRVTASRCSFFRALKEIRSLFAVMAALDKLLFSLILLLEEEDTDLKFTEFA